MLVHTYIVEFLHKPSVYIVSYDTTNKTFLCSCRKLEIVGNLCCHVLKVFDSLDIKTIHVMYILKIWTREQNMDVSWTIEEQMWKRMST